MWHHVMGNCYGYKMLVEHCNVQRHSSLTPIDLYISSVTFDLLSATPHPLELIQAVVIYRVH